MKNRIIALLLVIPIVLMCCIYSASNAKSLYSQIPVSGIVSTNSQEEYVDISDDSFVINSKVYPYNATNKGITYSITPIGNEKQCQVEIDENGKITPKSVGKAIITCTTNEGAYKSSFVLTVGSQKPTEIEIVAPQDKRVFYVGEEIYLSTNVYPQDINNYTVVWSSSDEDIIVINAESGKIKALNEGSCKIRATIENGYNGKVESSINVEVVQNSTRSGMLVFGNQNAEVIILDELCSLPLKITATNTTKDDVIVLYNNQQVESVQIVNGEKEGEYQVQVSFCQDFFGTTEMTLKLDKEGYTEYSSTIVLTRQLEGSFVFTNITQEEDVLYIQKGIRKTIQVDTDVQILDAEYHTEISNNEGVEFVTNLNYFSIKFNQNVECYLIVYITKNSTTILQKTYRFVVVDLPSSFVLLDQIQDNGIADQKAIASSKFDGQRLVENLYQVLFTNSDISQTDIVLESSNTLVAKIENNKIKVVDNGVVEITISHKLAPKVGKVLQTKIVYRCVLGVQVCSYRELINASELSLQIVLNNSIDLGINLVEKNGNTSQLKYSPQQCKNILLSEVSTTPVTFDWKYYKYSQNYDNAPTIYYCIKFTNNLFGNGYCLNANNITNVVDSTGSPYSCSIFNGPLDFVSVAGASVKAQDNIAFVLDDDVIVDNVELVGANLEGNESSDLNQLNYVGTTCEVIGKNVKIYNSKIRNGRTVLRIFGAEDVDKRVNVELCSCILSNAREFIFKMGTNKKLLGDLLDNNFNMADGVPNKVWNECSPKIENYTPYNSIGLSNSEYYALVEDIYNSKDFYSLTMTESTLRDCVLYNSGIFAIGLESSFAGPALDGGRWNSHNFYEYGWRDLAGTSYPTQLNLMGNTQIYDWKNIKNIDSSCLIEGDLFSFDMAEMINTIAQNSNYSSLLASFNGQAYVHTGIAMYGGGKNYCLVNDFSQVVEKHNLYTISFDDIDSRFMKMLKCAAGNQPFKLFMYDSNSEFDMQTQLDRLQSGIVYQKISKYEY